MGRGQKKNSRGLAMKQQPALACAAFTRDWPAALRASIHSLRARSLRRHLHWTHRATHIQKKRKPRSTLSRASLMYRPHPWTGRARSPRWKFHRSWLFPPFNCWPPWSSPWPSWRRGQLRSSIGIRQRARRRRHWGIDGLLFVWPASDEAGGLDRGIYSSL